MIEAQNEIIEPQTAKIENVFWGIPEVIYAIIAMLVISVAMVLIAYFWTVGANAVMVLYELLYLLPVVVVMLVKQAPWHSLGIRRFEFVELLIGIGLLLAAYVLIFIHNLTLIFFDIAPQGEYIAELFGEDINLWVLGVVIVIIAPIAEEVFFRSFVYTGLEEKLGWKKAALVSALIFGAAHMQLVSLLPTFLMGLVFAYLYKRSRSVVPGMILHFMVNGFGFTMILLLTLYGDSLAL